MKEITSWKGKKVFVSGGAGVIGTSLVKKLYKKGAIIFVGDLKPMPHYFPKDIIYRQGDLNYISKEELEEFSPEIFFHLAATFERTFETFEFWEENWHHNVFLSHHLVDCLKNNKSLKKVIFASSYLVYNPSIYSFIKPAEKPVELSETISIAPRNLCGASKFFHELELAFLKKFNPHYKVIIARIFRVYGRDSKDVISRWIRSLLRDEEIILFRKEGMFDFIFADDVAEGLIRLAESSFDGIVNLGFGKSRRIEEVIDILKNYFPNMKIKEVESDILYEASQADMKRFKQITGWSPKIRLEQGIQKLVKYYRKSKIYKGEKDNCQDINIMVTSISKKVPLLETIKKASLKLGNHGKIFGADMDENCIGKYFVDVFWKMPSQEKISIGKLLEYLINNKISCIIPTRDAELLFWAKYKDELFKKGIKVMVSNYKSVELCLDKLKFYEFLSRHNYPTVETSENINNIKAKSYVVKERFGAGARNIGLNLNKKEALLHAQKLKEPLFQPYIEGEEFSVDLYITNKGKTKGVVVRKRELVVGGESQITTAVMDEELAKICSNLAETLKLYGHVVIQVIKDKRGQLHIIECNPRFGGASTLSVECGLDSFYWFLLETLGEDLDDYPFIFTPKKLVRYPKDLIISENGNSIRS
jgi:carbamoyl-phosphate synthase large subunit